MTSRLALGVLIPLLGWLNCSTALAQSPSPEQLAFFEQRIRPLLVNKCVKCHGEKKSESGLRLDSRAALLKGGERGAAVQLRRVDESLLLKAVSGDDDDLKMPPEGRLSDTEQRALRAWLRTGAAWPAATRLTADDTKHLEHWAFQPIDAKGPPALIDSPGAAPIDAYIRGRLGKEGLKPSAPADPATLLRRVTWDLLGLPPTTEALDAFLSDQSPDAYERVVDRLLASPRFGERWARHWLDVARYADNKGYVFFEDKSYPWAYTYRDYVIRAFNSDLPFDRFVLEQLAADQLDLGDDKRPLTAMGFLTLGGHFMNNTHDIIDDRIDVVSRGLLGLTVTCARCHDHKFDPITQADYYSLYGVFRSSEEPILSPLFENPADTDDYRKFATGMEERVKKLRGFVLARHAELVRGAKERAAEYLMAAHAIRHHPPTDDFMLLTDKGAINPTMILRWRVYLENARKSNDPIWTPWHAVAELAEKDFASQSEKAWKALRAKSPTAIHPVVSALILEPPPASRVELSKRYGQLLNDIDARWSKVLAREKTDGRAPPLRFEDEHAESLRRVFHGGDAPPDVSPVLGWGFLALFPDRPTQGDYKKLLKEVEDWSTKTKGAPPRAMVLVDSSRPYGPRIFRRGNPSRLGEKVPRRFLSRLAKGGEDFRHGSGRLELARAITDHRNPLTARVIVNRFWRHHFGRGLVDTPSDFGLRGEAPTHPRLLDYLAHDLIRNGWSLKRLHRMIVTSETYRQRSLDRPEAVVIDPENRWLWRMNRRRLEFEPLRDGLLAAADQLDLRIGGPPINLLTDDVKPRRTIYGFVDRMDVSPLLTTFDFPNPAATSPRRSTTTVAPQALYLMNSPFLSGVAKLVAQRNDLRGLPVDKRLARLYRLLFSREITDEERGLAHGLLGDKPDEKRWKQLVHGLLLTNEFVFVD